MARGNGLSDAYTTTLTRLKGQKGNKSVLGMKVLMWVLYSVRPLRAEELCHALGVEIGSADPNLNNLPALRTLLASCLGLVTVEVSSSTVRLVHFTLQEHLLSDPTLFRSPHTDIAEVCLTYLNFSCIMNLSPLDSAPSTMALLEYASCYWGNHTRMGMTDNVKILAMRLLDRFDKHISAQLLLSHYNKNRGSGLYFHEEGGPMGFTGLHAVSFLGIVEIVADVSGMKEWDVNSSDCMWNTALTWAASKGYEVIVKVLLDQENVNPNKADSFYGRTPLSWAAMNGHEGVVRMLLGREDINPDQPGTDHGRTPLWWAVVEGHARVVKILLEREDVNPDRVDHMNSYTPLAFAAESGSEGVVQMLLEREDVDPSKAFHGRTALLLAAESGHEGVVNMLLERADVNPNQASTINDQTPLSFAAMNGHEGVVKILLEREDINPNHADTWYGQTPLSWAAESGYEEAVRMLLEREDVNPNQADTEYGRTPLAFAAAHGYNGVVKMLLERQDVSATTLDHQNQTPLSLALSRGHNEVVRTLRDNANSRTTDRGSQASLPPFAGHGDGRAVHIKPQIHNANINITGHNSRRLYPPANPDEREGVSDLKYHLNKPEHSGPSPAKPFRFRRLRSSRTLKFFFPSNKTNTHPNNIL